MAEVMNTTALYDPYPFGVPIPLALASFAGAPPWWMAGWLLFTPAGAMAAMEALLGPLQAGGAPAEPVPFPAARQRVAAA
jgi:hypothetical protein